MAVTLKINGKPGTVNERRYLQPRITQFPTVFEAAGKRIRSLPIGMQLA
jgi:hypothetical protein